jgi:hypothetical protein
VVCAIIIKFVWAFKHACISVFWRAGVYVCACMHVCVREYERLHVIYLCVPIEEYKVITLIICTVTIFIFPIFEGV